MYNNYFSYDSKDVIYIVICKNCNNFYLGQTQAAKHKSDLGSLSGYSQNALETATKLNHILKYSHSIMKQIERLEDITKNDTFSAGKLH